MMQEGTVSRKHHSSQMWWAGVLLIVVGAALAAPGVSGQRQAPPAGGAYAPPKLPDGQPDISGMYNPGWIGQPSEAPNPRWQSRQTAPSDPGAGVANDFGAQDFDAKDPNLTQAPKTRQPMLVDPADGQVPLLPWAAERRSEILDKQDSADLLDPRIRCLQAGLPRANLPVYYNSYQILQPPGQVVILYEWNHMTRVIPLDGRPHLDPRIRLPMGDSRGRWEGNTLVVDVTNFDDETWVIGHGGSAPGVFHSTDMHIVERFTPVSRNVIRYQATIEDPKVFSRPWTLSYDAFFRGAADHQLFEYACHEGNRDGILMMLGVDIDPDQAADSQPSRP
jgi:hypothetical protein